MRCFLLSLLACWPCFVFANTAACQEAECPAPFDDDLSFLQTSVAQKSTDKGMHEYVEMGKVESSVEPAYAGIHGHAEISKAGSYQEKTADAETHELVIDVYAHTAEQMKNASLMFKEFQAALESKGTRLVELKKLFDRDSVTIETKAGQLIGNATQQSVLESGAYPLKLRFVFKRKAELSDGDLGLHAVSSEAGVNATFNVNAATGSKGPDAATQWEADQFMVHTNYRRCLHAVPSVWWSWDLSWQAAWHAHHEQDAGYMYHDPGQGQGENLYWSSASWSWPEHIVESWYRECDDCHGGEYHHAPGCLSYNNVVGHYTALIWAGVTSMGCSYSEDNHYAVCRYMGSGALDCTHPNMQGCYEQNVPPASRNWWDCV